MYVIKACLARAYKLILFGFHVGRYTIVTWIRKDMQKSGQRLSPVAVTKVEEDVEGKE